MTGNDLLLALGGLDESVVLDAAPSEKYKKRSAGQIGKWTVAASFCLMLSLALALMLSKLIFQPIPDGATAGGVQAPDKGYTFNINERVDCTCGECFFVINNICLTSTVNGQLADNGGYLILEAEASTNHHWLTSSDILLGFDKTVKNVGYVFDEALSEKFSDTKNVFDRDTIEINGRVSYIFKLDNETYQELVAAVLDGGHGENVFNPGVSWCGGFCLYIFDFDDIYIVSDYQ